MNLADIAELSYLSNLDISFRLSDLYGQISKEHYSKFKISKSNLDSYIKKLMMTIHAYMNSALDEIECKSELISNLNNYKEYLSSPIDSSKLILSDLDKAHKVNKIIIEALKETDVFNKSLFNKDFDLNAYQNVSIQTVIKHGVITLAFEAFACEAFLNEELTLAYSKHYLRNLNSTKNKPLYIVKLDELGKLYKFQDFDLMNIAKRRLSKLMRLRNKIAHFQQYDYDLRKVLFYTEDIFYKNRNNEIYIGELLNNIDKNIGVFNMLVDLINHKSIT